MQSCYGDSTNPEQVISDNNVTVVSVPGDGTNPEQVISDNNVRVVSVPGDGTNSVQVIIDEIVDSNTFNDGLINGHLYEDSESSELERDYIRLNPVIEESSRTVITASDSDWRNWGTAEPIGSNSAILQTYHNLDQNNPINVEINVTSYYNHINGNYQEEFPIQDSSLNSTNMVTVQNGVELNGLLTDQNDIHRDEYHTRINTHYDGHNVIINIDSVYMREE